MACVLKHIFPEEIQRYPVFDVHRLSLQPKRLPYLSNFPLVCQLPAVSRDRGLSEAITADLLFEAIQLVTYEATFSSLLAFSFFLLLFFLPLTHIILALYISVSGKFWTTNRTQVQRKEKKKDTIWLLHNGRHKFRNCLFLFILFKNKQPLSFISTDDMKKKRRAHRI